MWLGSWVLVAAQAGLGGFRFDSTTAYIIGAVIVLVLFSNALHEAGHACVAWWSGDRREEIRRRMTLNPIKHVHWLLTIVLPIVSYLLIRFPVGGAKPVMVDAGKIGPRRMALVALAGPLGNAIFAVVFAILTAALMAFGAISEVNPIASPTFRALILSIWLSVWLVVLNLVPLPPADGSRVLAMFMPARVRAVYYAMAPVTVIILIVGVIWVSGMLHRYVPALGRGYPHIFMKAQTWVEDQVFDLVDPIKRLGGK